MSEQTEVKTEQLEAKTPEVVETAATETQVEATEEPAEIFDRKYVVDLRNENLKYRLRAKEAQEKLDALEAARQAEIQEAERAKLDEVERLKLEREEALKLVADAKAEAKKANLKAQLAGKVQDADAALAVAEAKGLVTEEGLDVDAFLETHSYFAIPTQIKAPVAAANAGASNSQPITKDFIAKQSPQWINENWEQVQAALKK